MWRAECSGGEKVLGLYSPLCVCVGVDSGPLSLPSHHDEHWDHTASRVPQLPQEVSEDATVIQLIPQLPQEVSEDATVIQLIPQLPQEVSEDA